MTHLCKGELPYSSCGECINLCEEKNNGEYWIGNGEYSSRVNYCPYCGSKAPSQTHFSKFESGDKVILKEGDNAKEVEIFAVYVTNNGVSYAVSPTVESLEDDIYDVPEEKLVAIAG